MLLFMAWFHLSDPPWICNGSLARQPLVSVVVDGCHQQTQMPMLLGCREVFSSMRSTLEEPQRSLVLSTMEISSQRCPHQRIVMLAMLTMLIITRQVNETDFKSITHKDALAALRASDKVKQKIKEELFNSDCQIYLNNLKHLKSISTT